MPFRLNTIEGDGFHILIPATINGKKANMLIDTGASKTVFDINRIGYFLQEQVDHFEVHSQLSTGLGTNSMESRVTNLKKFSIGDFRVYNFPALLLDMTYINQSYAQLKLKPIDGVIGSDLLVHLHAQINFNNRTLKIRPKPLS